MNPSPTRQYVCPCARMSLEDIFQALDDSRGNLLLASQRTGLGSFCHGCEPTSRGLVLEWCTQRGVALTGQPAALIHTPVESPELGEVGVWETAWVIEDDRLHTRVLLPNLPNPDVPQDCIPVPYQLRLHDSAGRVVLAKEEGVIQPGHTAIWETRDLLTKARQAPPFHGNLTIMLKRRSMGTMRAYHHWYNDRFIAWKWPMWRMDALSALLPSRRLTLLIWTSSRKSPQSSLPIVTITRTMAALPFS